MELKKGQVVRSIAGHDNGDFQIVLEVQGKYLLLCDGKRHTIEKPKKKKPIHVATTTHIIGEENLCTDRHIRKALKPFKENNA